MKPVLVVIDHLGPDVRGPGQELLTLAGRLGPVHAVWLGGGGDAPVDQLARFGAQQVHQVDTRAVNRHLTRAAAAAIGAVAGRIGAGLILLTSTFENKEVAAALAVITGAGVVVDAREVSSIDGAYHVTQDVFAATWQVESRIDADVAVVALKPMSIEPLEAPVDSAVLERTELDVTDVVGPVQLVDRAERAASVRPELDEARTVVVGGRGVDGDFGPVEELADLLGAAVGATRVATDEGWISRTAQVGQTGATIAPELYIGVGVSGAVHHTAGMRGARTIVAVNTDPAAPIFEIADFGVVGDVAAVIPQAIAALRAAQHQS